MAAPAPAITSVFQAAGKGDEEEGSYPYKGYGSKMYLSLLLTMH